jgi:hypothetical protein
MWALVLEPQISSLLRLWGRSPEAIAGPGLEKESFLDPYTLSAHIQ